MGLKKNNPGCGCCGVTCAHCIAGILPANGLLVTIAGTGFPGFDTDWVVDQGSGLYSGGGACTLFYTDPAICAVPGPPPVGLEMRVGVGLINPFTGLRRLSVHVSVSYDPNVARFEKDWIGLLDCANWSSEALTRTIGTTGSCGDWTAATCHVTSL